MSQIVIANNTLTGYFTVGYDQIALATTVASRGRLTVNSGGTANETTVDRGGSMTVSSGGTATAIKENGGYVEVGYGVLANFVANVISGLDISGDMTVHSGTTANSTTVNSGWLYVYSGGTANSTTVNSGGRLYVSSGGTANETTVDRGGSMTVSSGGTATAIKENGGYVAVGYGVLANFVANVISGLDISGYMTVHSGTTANSTTLNRGHLYVSSGGTANSTTVNSEGRLDVYSGGTANSTTLNSGGSMYVASGGTTNSTTLNAGGRLDVYSGGTAINIFWTPCIGQVFVGDGAYASFVSSYSGCYLGTSNQLLASALSMTGNNISGEMYVFSKGVVESASVNGGRLEVGRLEVWNGGTANSTTLNGGRLYVSSGGTANSTTVNGGGLTVSSGGMANSTTLNEGGCLDVYSGGTANGVTVKNGSMTLSSGGTMTGNLRLSPEGAVIVWAVSGGCGGSIDFLVAEQTNRSEALVNHFDYIWGTADATYTVTINADQECGDYHLADYAQSFTQNVLVKTTEGTNIGYITGWNDLTVGSTTYGISLNTNGTLIFSVGKVQENTPPTITHIQADVTALTSGDVHVSAVFADETELAQSLYRIGDGDWQNYTGSVTMSDNGTLYFKAVDGSGNVTEASYTVSNIDKVAPVAVGGLTAQLAGNIATITWNTTTDYLAGVAQYEFQLSDQADFSHLVATQSGATLTNNIATLTTTGRYHYRVRATDAVGNSSEWSSGSIFFEAAVEPKPVNLTAAPSDKVVVGTAGADLFNLTPNGEWGTLHVARWNGDASASVSLAGRNRYYDALDGAGGYDTIQLAAGDNGLVYSDLLTPSASNADAAARLAGIAEIRGNSGSDLIDMTAARSSYAGDLLLKGGDGDDHLWAGSGDDILVGGSGNDDLRGGDGDDIYLFGAAWGRDTVVDTGGTLVFDSTLEGHLAFSAVGNSTRITCGDNTVELNWNVAAGDVCYADIAALTEFRRDTIKGFLA